MTPGSFFDRVGLAAAWGTLACVALSLLLIALPRTAPVRSGNSAFALVAPKIGLRAEALKLKARFVSTDEAGR